MPIENLTNKRWLPRLGKIRLGVKETGQSGKEYPRAVDYFVCPPEVQAVFGEKPKQLKIMFPSDNPEVVAPQWMKCYSYSQGLICKGDARTCRRKVDVDTGEVWVNRETKQWEYKEFDCVPEHCEKIGDGQCKRVMSLIFCIPDVPGLGIYQLDSSSYYSIMNINSEIGKDPPGFIRIATNPLHPEKGRISWLPLVLSVGPQEVNPQGAGRKTVYVLNLHAEIKLVELVAASRKSLPALLGMPELAEEEPPDDLFPQGVIGAEEEGAAEAGEPVSDPDEGDVVPSTAKVVSSTKEPVSVTESPVLSTARPVPVTKKVTENAEPVARKAVAPNCECPKPVPAVEVIIRDYSCYHTKCAGYLCTPGIDCSPGCPHTPLEKSAATGKLPPGWDKVTKEQVPDYLELEKVWCQLNPGKSTRELYRRLGIGGRNEATIKAWDAFLTLKETAKEPN